LIPASGGVSAQRDRGGEMVHNRDFTKAGSDLDRLVIAATAIFTFSERMTR
jgi:hypothetical protein